MGYALVDVLPLLQAASVGGVPALTFCVALAPMTVALAIASPKQWRAALIAGAVPLVLIACAGALRLNQSYDSQTRVALVGLDKYEGRAYRSETKLSKQRAHLRARCASSCSKSRNTSSLRKSSWVARARRALRVRCWRRR